MLYLATTVKKNFKPPRLKLLAYQRESDRHWLYLSSVEILCPGDVSLSDGMLAFVELEDKRVIEVVPAELRIISILQQATARIVRLDKEEEEARLWRESLEYQSEQLALRLQTVEVKEKSLSIREEKFLAMLAKVREEFVQVERERKALEGAWEHLRFRESEVSKATDS